MRAKGGGGVLAGKEEEVKRGEEGKGGDENTNIGQKGAGSEWKRCEEKEKGRYGKGVDRREGD